MELTLQNITVFWPDDHLEAGASGPASPPQGQVCEAATASPRSIQQCSTYYIISLYTVLFTAPHLYIRGFFFIEKEKQVQYVVHPEKEVVAVMSSGVGTDLQSESRLTTSCGAGSAGWASRRGARGGRPRGLPAPPIMISRARCCCRAMATGSRLPSPPAQNFAPICGCGYCHFR